MAPPPNIYTDTTVNCRAALTFFGLGRIAPEEEHTAVRAGVTVPPRPETLVVNEEVFLSTDNLARTPSAEAAMLTMFSFSLLLFLRVCFLTQLRHGNRVMVLVSTAPPSVNADSLHAGRSRSKTKYVSSRVAVLYFWKRHKFAPPYFYCYMDFCTPVDLLVNLVHIFE